VTRWAVVWGLYTEAVLPRRIFSLARSQSRPEIYQAHTQDVGKSLIDLNCTQLTGANRSGGNGMIRFSQMEIHYLSFSNLVCRSSTPDAVLEPHMRYWTIISQSGLVSCAKKSPFAVFVSHSTSLNLSWHDPTF